MRNKLSSKRRLLPVVLAAGALLVAAILPTEAGAAIKSNFPIVGSIYCKGTLAGSADTTDVPNGDFIILGAFAGTPTKPKPPKGTIFNVAPTSSEAGPIELTMGIYTDNTCVPLDQNQLKGPSQDPCAQTLYSKGTYSGVAKHTTTGTLVVGPFDVAPSINQYPPQPAGSDPFQGCTWTFTVTPDLKHSDNSILAFTAQTGTCAVGGSITNFGCKVNNSCTKADSSSC